MKAGSVTVGHPVNVATGAVYLNATDCEINGRLPLVWERTYSSTAERLTPLGRGWTTRYFATLTHDVAAGEYRFLAPEGETEIFADADGAVAKGGVIRHLETFQELAQRGSSQVVTRWDVETGVVERFVFRAGKPGEPWPLIGIEDAEGRRLELLYDEQGWLAGIRQRNEGRTLAIAYDESRRISALALKLPEGRSQTLARFEYDGQGNLSAAYDAAGAADRYEYDSHGRLVREFRKDGGVFSFRYNEQGRCIRTLGNEGYDEKTFRYLEQTGWTEVTDSQGYASRYQWLPSGQVTASYDPLGGKRTVVYDEIGRISAKSDPNGGVTRYEYDAQGNRAKLVDPLGNQFTLTFNDGHLPVTMTAPNGGVWRRVYDACNRLVASEDPLGGRWAFGYDERGNLTEIVKPTGERFRQSYLDNDREQVVADWQGNLVHYRFDDFGRIAEEIGSQGETTRFSYSLTGQLTEVVFPDGAVNRARYDAGGNLTHFIDGNGHATQYRYGPCGRLLQRIDPMGAATGYRWGLEPRRLLAVVNEKDEEFRFTYDAAGRVVATRGFDGLKREFQYDPAGFCTAASANGELKIAYSRDANGNVVKESLADGGGTAFTYDGFGNVIAAVNGDCSTSFERDLMGRITREAQDSYWLQHRYDAGGRRTQTLTSLGHEAGYAYTGGDKLRQLTLGDGARFDFARNARGKEIARLLPGGLRLEQDYDEAGQLAEQRVCVSLLAPGKLASCADDTAIIHTGSRIKRSYRYDRSRSLTSIKDGLWGETDYAYDPAQRLVSAMRENGSEERFGYDATGNLERRETEPAGYGPGDRLLRHGTTRYDYDDLGRLCKKVVDEGGEQPQEWLFAWDDLDQLRSVTRPDGEVWSYAYDALGRRIAKQGPDGAIRYVWDGGVVLHQAAEGETPVTWLFEPRSFKAVGSVQEGEVYAVIADHLGTPRELLDEEGAVAWAASYQAWGELDEVKSGGAECPLRFPGQWFDEESGLHYSRFRYYDPHDGRFISPDPISLAGGANLYAYAQNPITRSDPYGLKPKCDDEEEEDPYDAVNPKYRDQVRDAFSGKPKLVTLDEDLVVYRHWGGKSNEFGSPWYAPKQYNYPGNAQRYLALPEGNTAANVTPMVIPKGTTILVGKVAPQTGTPGFGSNAVGGGTQIYVPNPSVVKPL